MSGLLVLPPFPVGSLGRLDPFGIGPGCSAPCLQPSQVDQSAVDLGKLRAHPALYPVLGYHVGALVGDRVPVLTGVPPAVRATDLKAFCAAAASSGSLALAHAVGVTPEAPTLAVALGGRAARETVGVTLDDLRRAREQLSFASASGVDFVKIGCPHLSLPEAIEVAEQARREGVRDLRQSGLLKVRQGVTSLEEVEAVTNE